MFSFAKEKEVFDEQEKVIKMTRKCLFVCYSRLIKAMDTWIELELRIYHKDSLTIHVMVQSEKCYS